MTNQSILALAGMHRSGTSLTASILQSTGLDIGDRLMSGSISNAKGHFEDWDFVEFHEAVFKSQGVAHEGWTEVRSISVQEQYLERARNLVSARENKIIWGWKDPRTTLFLDFWAKLIPEAKFILVYRTPWEVVDSLFRRGDGVFKHNPNFAIKIWNAYNRATLDFYDRNEARSIILRIEDIIGNPNEAIAAINYKFGLQLGEPDHLYDESLFKTYGANSYRATLIKQYFPEAFELYWQLHQRRQVLENSPIPLIDQNSEFLALEPWILQDWLDKHWLDRENNQSQQQLQSTQAQLEQSQQQLQSTQTELERLKNIQAELKQAEQQLQSTQAQLEQSQQQLQAVNTEVQTQKQIFASLRDELIRERRQLQNSQESAIEIRQELEQTTQQRNLLQALLQAMETSKFWQVRNWWLDLKKSLKLPINDELYQSYLNNVSNNLALDRPQEEHLAIPQSSDPLYQQWLVQNYPKPAKLELMRAKLVQLPYKPKISVIVPVYNTPETFLLEAIESVREQIYPYWELCIADDCSTELHVRVVLEEYLARDDRIKVVFCETNRHISRTSNEALSLATGEYIACLDHDDLLTPHALYKVVELLNEHPEADFIYSDEDKLDENNYYQDPYFKPDWCPDSFLSRMYTCHLGVYRRALVSEIGGFREGFEGSQDYDLVLRLTEKTENIFHIPDILYHWRIHARSTAAGATAKPYAYEAGRKAITEAIARRGEPGEVIHKEDFPGVYTIRYEIKEYKPVSIIIPTRDFANTLDICLRSIFTLSTYPNYEVIVIDNGSVEAETFECFEYWQTLEPERFSYHTYDIPFHYPRLNNYAVGKAKGDYLLFLNNDTEVTKEDWIEAMVEQAQRKSIGAVGGLLLYSDRTIQHAGVVLGIGGVAGHSHKFLPADKAGYISQVVATCNYSAVTGACLMSRRKVFEEIGGFEEDLAVAFNDVDLCLKILDRGYRNIYLPHVVLYHYESKTRGFDNTPEKQARFANEATYMRQKWQSLFDRDPCYNPNLTLKTEDYSLKVD
jgi:GT2 family glycosyltransferase/predicted  nucleic acid-binding Zn-ribbon protein